MARTKTAKAGAVKNRTIFTRDNLEVLRGMDSGTVDLVYLDPPFNSKRDYAAPVGSKAAGAAFKDTWSLNDIKEEWHGLIAADYPALYKVIDAAGGKSDKAYLLYMSMRLLELRRIMKTTGSIYYHCDPTMSHSVKLVMDAIFGRANFRNEIIWCYTGPSNTKRYFPRKHDCLLFYAKDGKSRYVFDGDAVRREYAGLHIGGDKFGGGMSESDIEDYLGVGKIPEDWWDEKRDGMTPVGRLKRERVGYPTQKPLALLRRIVAASSKKGGMVLDPFCGCATTCIAAEQLGRQWIGIDISPKAAELVKERLLKEADIAPARSGMLLPKGYVIHREDIPQRRKTAKRSPPRLIKQFLFGKQEGKCNGCLQSFDYRHFHTDHIVPVSKGGQDTDSNKQLLCGHCNILKGDRDMAHLKTRLRQLNIMR